MQATLPAEWDVNAPEDFHPFHVVVVYDNSGAGQRAMSTLMTLVDQSRRFSLPDTARGSSRPSRRAGFTCL